VRKQRRYPRKTRHRSVRTLASFPGESGLRAEEPHIAGVEQVQSSAGSVQIESLVDPFGVQREAVS